MEYIEVSFEISPFKEDYAEQIIALIEDLDFEQLHNVLHKNIEREDDPEV